MKILLTGGSGFIGSQVLNTLTQNIDGATILNLTRTNSNSNSKKVEFFKCDLSIPETYKSKIESFGPEVVIHLAWEGIPDFSLEMSSKNILSSISFIDIVTNIKTCKKIIVTGSCFEYNNKIGSSKEDDVVIPKDYFTFAKKTILSFLELQCNKNNILYAWTRLFYVYGPNQRSGSLIPTLIETIKSNKSPELRTPKNANDFIHVNDVADGILTMVLTHFKSGIFNIGSGVTIPVTEISKIIEFEIRGSYDLSNELISKTIATEKTVDFYADMEKTNKILNWRPKRQLSNEIKILIKE
jgi:nucleoside-diphosphate-sugar epimerase